MRRSTSLRSLALVVATSVALSGGCTHYKVVKDGELNPPALRRVEERTADVRGLPFQEPVRAEVYTKSDSGRFFRGEGELSDEEKERARREDLVAHRLGMLPDGVSLQDLFQKALTNNAAGVYQPPDEPDDGEEKADADEQRGGRLFIVQDALPRPVRAVIGGFGYLTGTDWANELFLSHELMHALQDQHFDLNRVLPKGLFSKNEDMAIARKSVVESEANLVSQAYLLGVDLDSLVQRNALIEYLAFGRFIDVITTRLMNPDLPPFYAKVLVEQYTQGMRFLQYVTNEAGWKGVNEAYAGALPRSTEQLIHPEKLFDEVDPPRYLPPLDEGDRPASLEGYTHLDGNVLGQLMLRIYLEDYISGASAAAAGWGGDRYDVFERNVDGVSHTLLTWRTLWDTEEDAAELAAAYAGVIQAKYPGRITKVDDEDLAEVRRELGADVQAFLVAPKPPDPTLPGVRTPLPEVAVVARDGLKVLVLEGAPKSRWRALTEELLEEIDDDPSVAPTLPPPSAEAIAAADIDFVRETPPPLKQRVFMPHHKMVFRFGLGMAVDHASEPGSLSLGLALDREFRWGFRQNLEWTAPYLLSVSLVDNDRLQTVITSGLGDLGLSFSSTRGLVLRGQPVLQLTQAVHLNRYLGVVAQGGVETWLSTDLTERPALTVQGALAGYTAIGDLAVLSLGASYRASLQVDHLLTAPRLIDPVLVLGAATNRARPVMPTIELKIYDGLHLYEASQVFVEPRTLTLLGHRHVAGLMLYF